MRRSVRNQAVVNDLLQSKGMGRESRMNRMHVNALADRSAPIPAAVIVASLALITYLHYSTAPGFVGLHAVYRYFYFLPIVYAALRYGFRIGVLTALAASLLFAPHIIFKWGNFPGDSINDLLVVVVFLGVAVITGHTIDRLHEAQANQARTAAELAASLHMLESQGEELRRAERLSSLGRLAGGLAHQIRNPVGIIRASAQLLTTDGDREARETAAVIEEETDRIEHLVQDLLHYADVTPLERVPTNIGDIIARVAQRVRPLADTTNTRVVVAVDTQLPLIPVDPKQLEQALLNLTVNALQAMEEGGKVTLAACTGDHLGVVEVRVADTGPGISEHDQQRIFDPFFSTKDDGIGLGLSVVYRIFEDHGAPIEVQSAPGQGTTFLIRLPTVTA